MMATLTPDSLPVFNDFTSFLTYPELWPVFFSLLMLGASGGLFIVPLYTLMQTQARENERAQIIAANNIYNSIYMVGSAVLGIVCLSVFELAIPTLFLLLAVLNIFVATYMYWQVPMFLSRLVLWMFTHTM
mgnify:FL=1